MLTVCRACQAPADAVEVARERLQRLGRSASQVAVVAQQLLQRILTRSRSVMFVGFLAPLAHESTHIRAPGAATGCRHP